ncbi:hypothetical protein JCM9140_764 [Halalkalibacter wakoensis JCM 9140]|uniref:Uncharacterized protein n=2 Tax=Halalkalibacter wakoensis TaxID=127891 RepID=W4PYK4_9BACI|nr:hypothetical protein JCM9140_764 [Halalkalibacter wakoensis JCM 9140]
MQIQQPIHTLQQSERPIPIREGDVYKVTVKEQRGANEALLSLRGREMVATFDGAVPSGERTTIQVIYSEQDHIRVKVIHDEGKRGTSHARTGEQGQQQQQSVTQTLRQFGIQHPSSELRQAVAIVMDKGVPLSKEAVRDLHRFVNEGRVEQRLHTVEVLANKRIEVTSTHLRSIHETLHGRPVSGVLQDLAKELNRDFKLESAPRERFERPNSVTQHIREVRQDVQTARTVQQASEQIESRLIQSDRVSRDQAGQLDRIIQQARMDAGRGHERVGLERIAQGLERLERDVQSSQERGQTNQVREGNSARAVDSNQDVRNLIQRESLTRASERVQQLANQPQVDRQMSRVVEQLATEVRNIDRVGTDRVIQTLQHVEREAANPSERQLIQGVRQQVEQHGLSLMSRERIESLSRQLGENRTPGHEQLTREVRQMNQTQQLVNDRLISAVNQLENQAVTKKTSTQALHIREVHQDVQTARTVQQASEQVERRLIQPERISRDQAGQLDRVIQQARTDAGRGQERVGLERIAQGLERLERDVQSSQERGQTNQVREGNSARAVDSNQDVRNLIQRESLTRASERVQQLANQPQVDRQTSRAVERLVTEARQLDKISVERLSQALQQAERGLNTEPERQALSEVRQQLAQQGLTNTVQGRIETIVGQISTNELSKSLRQSVQLQHAGNERLQQSLQLMEKRPQVETSHVRTLSEVTSEAFQTLRREPSLEQAIQKVNTLLNNHSELTAGQQNRLNESVSIARELQQQGRELKARQELANFIQEIDKGIQQQQVSKQDPSSYTRNEEFQTSIEVASKAIAVTTITEKMAQMTVEFKKLQRDITRNLDLVNRQIEQFRHQAQPQAKPLLETTIKNLDHAILKSEMMLVTDMKTERQLMVASSQLTEAKKLLNRGQYRQANEIVQEVKRQVEQLQFKPSETKVKHYTAANEQALRELPAKGFEAKYVEVARGPIQEGSPRSMFEMVRSLGLNRDSEIALQLASGREQQESSDRNLKSLLMQIAKGEEEGSRVQQLANQALTNVTGQQLMSRSDQQSNLQSLYFQLPLLLEDKVENLQVFVNSRNEGQKVDWENCSLYFLMETPKMGEIGIVISATERQLSVTLKNNKIDFKEKMAPLVEMAVTKLGEIGYSINGINYSKLNSVEKPTTNEQESSQLPVFGEKGFDYKI